MNSWSDSISVAGSLLAGTYVAAGTYISAGTYLAAGSYVDATTYVQTPNVRARSNAGITISDDGSNVGFKVLDGGISVGIMTNDVEAWSEGYGCSFGAYCGMYEYTATPGFYNTVNVYINAVGGVSWKHRTAATGAVTALTQSSFSVNSAVTGVIDSAVTLISRFKIVYANNQCIIGKQVAPDENSSLYFSDVNDSYILYTATGTFFTINQITLFSSTSAPLIGTTSLGGVQIGTQAGASLALGPADIMAKASGTTGADLYIQRGFADASSAAKTYVGTSTIYFQGTNADRTFYFASDATLLWHELGDHFAFNKAVEFDEAITMASGKVLTTDRIDAVSASIGVAWEMTGAAATQLVRWKYLTASWNMHTAGGGVSAVNIAHGLTDSTIIGVIGVVYEPDGGVIFSSICTSDGANFEIWFGNSNTTGNVRFARRTGGTFDAVAYNNCTLKVIICYTTT